MAASAWNTILTAPELDAHYALTASLGIAMSQRLINLRALMPP